MYDRSQWYSPLVQKLMAQDKRKILDGRYVFLVRVELGLRLLEWLDLCDEPITVLWVVLDDLPLPDERLIAWNERQRRAIANARVLLPFSGRFAWEHALREYAIIPEAWRCYVVQPGDPDRQLLLPTSCCPQERLLVYDKTLASVLPFAQRTIRPAEANIFCFDAITTHGKQVVQVAIPEDIAEMASSAIPWFTSPRDRGPMNYSYEDFRKIAVEIEELRQERGLAEALGSRTSWVDLVENLISYRAVASDGSLTEKNTTPLKLDGYAYVVGAVASGKSTMAKLILADAALHPEKDMRVTLVVGDTMSALNLADDFNRLFCQWGEQPVAVPLLGRSTRDRHLKHLYRSSQFRSDHWALRWLNTACPLQALVTDSPAQLVTPGNEPCEALYKPLKKPKQRKNYQYCPLFATCPAKQLYRDMPGARIWITTPGALGVSRIPAQVEKRMVHLTNIVYEQSDLVIFDEADMVQAWFDDLFAGETVLTNEAIGNGLLDVEDVESAQAWIPQRAQPAATRRWLGAERQSLTAISNILSSLADIEHGAFLRHWIGRHFFTALTLAYKLVWRLLGYPEWDSEEFKKLDQIKASKEVQAIVAYFEQLSYRDPLTMRLPIGVKAREEDAVSHLAQIMRFIIAAGDSGHNPAIREECWSWLQAFIPNIEQTMQQLERTYAQKQTRGARAVPLPTRDTFALCLEFVLNVMTLDRNVQIVFYEWYNKPENMMTALNEHSLERSPRYLMDVLPIPPTGRMFGTYYSKEIELGRNEEKKQRGPASLSIFAYQNIGRWYTMNFHQLFTNLDGRRGPNVLALSGTSWLPHSSRWHIDIQPQGMLDPSLGAQQAIAQSSFFYCPQYKKEGNKVLPIRVSGSNDMLQALKNMIRVLTDEHHVSRASFKKELEKLRELGQQQPHYWRDRERLLLLVNSYEQAKHVFEALRASSQWKAAAPGEIQYLSQAETDEDEERVDDILYRSDVEDFALTNGKILIAPLQAIGRGYNILNREGKAAFGSIYFLTRPMPFPADTQVLAQELNRRTLDWCKDSQFPAWQEPELIGKALELRRTASAYWRKAELRSFYRLLEHEDENGNITYSERLNLAATTAGHINQACGRLLRGGVPFRAYFIDAAWAPETARQPNSKEAADTSLLAAVIQVLQDYMESPIGEGLYASIVDALVDIHNFQPE
uniref:pPIWI-RE three-gene island domain-containing protein n=1 Tax=Thermosporothrix sp. COM3 TaxID=2490863 RepID=A0A455SVU3_9CHLR|nr:hypothetical protein KTC_64470 [Thermosporothrix sp. COM3]